jgi:hypothetical protein
MFDLAEEYEEYFKKPETLPELIAYIDAREIICPGHYWYKLYELIKFPGDGYHNPPCILAGSMASDKKKYDRFIEHLERADEIGVLEDVINFLGRLTKERDFLYGERPLGDWKFEW